MSELSEQESLRLEKLRGLNVLDTPREPEFDNLVQAAALVCDVPISLISLVDVDRQWFKANVGLTNVTQTPRDVSFCSHAIVQDDLLEISDTHLDAQFASNRLVTEDPQIRFYAGVPLRLSDGCNVGTLCVIDRKAKKLNEQQKQILKHLACAAAKSLENRQSANKLAVSQAKFEALSESSPVGIFSFDHAGECTYTNKQLLTILDMKAEQAAGQGWIRTIHPDDRDSVFRELQRTSSLGLNFDMNFRLKHEDDTVLDVRAISRPVISESRELSGHVGTIENVTLRKQARGALRQSEALLREISELANVGGVELDIATGQVRWSEQYCHIHGVEIDYQPTLQEAIELYHFEDQPRIRQAIENALSTGASWDLELRLLRGKDQNIWVRFVGHTEVVNGKSIRLLGALQDITTQVLHRQALQDATMRVTLATESGKIGIYEKNIQEGTLEWTDRMFALHDLPVSCYPMSDEIWLDRLHPEDRESTLLSIRNALKHGDRLDTEYRVIRRNGQVRHLLASAQITRDKDGVATKMLGVNWDITSLRKLSSDLAAQAELLRVTLESIGDAVITTDAWGNVSWQNPVAEAMTGWSSSAAIGRPLQQVFHTLNEDTRLPSKKPNLNCSETKEGDGVPEHTLLISRNGVEYGIEGCAAPILDREGTQQGAVLVFHDVTEQRLLSREMSYRAKHDALTGLMNRVEFEARLAQALLNINKRKYDCTLMYIDLDQFKLVNDACGHSAGDQLLVRIAKLLSRALNENAVLARLGGDEFGVILYDCDKANAIRIAQGICSQMNDFRFVNDDRRFRIGSSIGLVWLDDSWPDTTAAMKAADICCYAAKESGRNRVYVWSETDNLMRLHRNDMQWANRIEEALDENRFELFYQKIYPLRAECNDTHLEVLLRLRERDGTLTTPNTFLPAAERFNLATRIDHWVLENAIGDATSIVDSSGVGIICINLSGQSVSDRVFHQKAIQLLTLAGDSVCRCLCLEITETAAVTNMTEASVFIDQARALGVRVALDDFGSGASSFGYLRKLTVDYLKIDGQFIQNLTKEPLNQVAVKCFADVANVLGIKTIAEFVDSDESLAQIHALGIDYAQGYLKHKPEPVADFLTQANLKTERAESVCD